jgi:multisubunit Na+/H+ antiporter MnhB subunit
MSPVLFIAVLVVTVLGMYIIWGNRERWHISKGAMWVFSGLAALIVIYLIYWLSK